MSEAKLHNVKSENLDVTNLSLGVSEDNSDSKKKAKKVLLSELEQLMSVMSQVEDSKSGASTSDLKKILNKIVSGSKDLDVSDILEAIKAVIKKDGGNISTLSQLAQEMMEDSPGTRQAKKYLNKAQVLLKDVMKAVDDGETSLEEIFGDEDFQAFLGAFGGERTSSSFQAVGSKAVTHQEALMRIAVALQNLLSTVYSSQTSQGDLYSNALKDQLASIQATTEDRIKDIRKEQSEQASAAKKPWYMYLIGAIVAVVGAVISFFTAGAAAAVVGLLVAGIMMSPIGDDLTNALVKMFLGNNTNPTEAQQTGAHIGATAIVTVLMTILSMGASGFTSGAEGALEGGLSDAAAASSDVAASVTENAGGLAMEMTEMGDSAGTTIARQLQEEEEETVQSIEEAADAVEGSSDDSSSSTSGGSSSSASKLSWTKFINQFKNLKFDKEALMSGFGKRLIGNLIVGFLASGGLTEIVELIAQSNPDWKKVMDSTGGAVALTVISALVAIGGTVASSKLLIEPGIEERANYLEFKGKGEAVLDLNQNVIRGLRGISILAQVANAGVGVSKYVQYNNIAALKELIGTIEAAIVTQTSTLKGINTTQSGMNKAFLKDASTISTALKTVLDALGADQLQTARSMS